MKRILVPTDFSPTAEKAFRFAIDIAERNKGTVILYHVYTPAKTRYIGIEKISTLANQQRESNLIKRLQRLKKKVSGDKAIPPISTVLGRTPLLDNILGFAEHEQIDLIVMGTQGASKLKKNFWGSVAAKVAENSGIPVIMVPEKYEWKEPEHIVFATDYNPSDKKALSILTTLASLYNTRIDVLHVFSVYESEMEKEKLLFDFETYAQRIQKEFADSKLKFHIVKTTSVFQTIENLDREFPHDLLVMVRRKKSFYENHLLESFTKNMVYITQKPFLIVPEEE